MGYKEIQEQIHTWATNLKTRNQISISKEVSQIPSAPFSSTTEQQKSEMGPFGRFPYGIIGTSTGEIIIASQTTLHSSQFLALYPRNVAITKKVLL